MAKVRVYLADDHAVVREGLKSLINAQADMEVIGEAGDGRTAVQQASQLQPDVVILDISMPELNGAQAARQLKAAQPAIKLLALTIHEDKSYLQELLAAGASGYVLKRAAAEELIRAIRVVLMGGTYLDPAIASKVVSEFVHQPTASASQPANELSEREREVVLRIAQGYSNREIAAQLNISVKTVETYKARSMEKLGLYSRADLFRYAHQRGWLAEP